MSVIQMTKRVGATEFEDVWSTYPRKVSKRVALKAWMALTTQEKTDAAMALPNHIRHWKVSGTERVFIPHFSTWLRQARWEDELEPEDLEVQEKQPDWWRSLDTISAEAKRRGVGDARPGESTEQWVSRIRKAPVTA